MIYQLIGKYFTNGDFAYLRIMSFLCIVYYVCGLINMPYLIVNFLIIYYNIFRSLLPQQGH